MSPGYLIKYVNLRSTSNYQTRSQIKTIYKSFPVELKALSIFSPLCITEWNKLDSTIGGGESIKEFKSMLKNFFSLNQRWLFSIHDTVGVKLLTRLRLQFTLTNTNFVIISKTAWVSCVIVVLKPKQPVTFSCIDNFSQ